MRYRSTVGTLGIDRSAQPMDVCNKIEKALTLPESNCFRGLERHHSHTRSDDSDQETEGDAFGASLADYSICLFEVVVTCREEQSPVDRKCGTKRGHLANEQSDERECDENVEVTSASACSLDRREQERICRTTRQTNLATPDRYSHDPAPKK